MILFKDILEYIKRCASKVVHRPTVVFETRLLSQKVKVSVFETTETYFRGYQYGWNIDLYIPVNFFEYGLSLRLVYIHELIHIVQFYKDPVGHTVKTKNYLTYTEIEAYIKSIIFCRNTPIGYDTAIKDLYDNLDIDRLSIEHFDIERDYFDAIKASIPDKSANFYYEFNRFLKKLCSNKNYSDHYIDKKIKVFQDMV